MLFERAARQKLRFQSPQGNVTAEDLWDIVLPQLNKMAKALKKELRESEEEDFLQTRSAADVKTQLKFDIVLHVLNVKVAEQEAREARSARKEEKEKILSVLARKQDTALENLSEAELEAKLNSLS
jgi:tRNA nucleotidyltransferase (CCA-adding enzyme)